MTPAHLILTFALIGALVVTSLVAAFRLARSAEAHDDGNDMVEF